MRRQAGIIELCGLDVRTATVEGMDRAMGEMRLVCMARNHMKHEGLIPLYTWRAAVRSNLLLTSDYIASLNDTNVG